MGCSFMLILHTDTQAGLSYNPKKVVVGIRPLSRRSCKSPFFRLVDATVDVDCLLFLVPLFSNLKMLRLSPNEAYPTSDVDFIDCWN